MSDQDKLNLVKTLLDIPSSDVTQDELISAYLSLAAQEIISWRYSYSASAEEYTLVPSEYEVTQVMAVVAGYSQGGAENQTQHSENGIQRQFKYADMVAYIRAHVRPMCRVT